MSEVCHRCGGTGQEPDDRGIGKEMRVARLAAGLTLREVARRLGMSATYLSDLERGQRHWHADILAAYHETLGGRS